MRTTSERMAELDRRLKQAEQKKKDRRNDVLAFSLAAASLCLVVGLSFAMPGLMAQIAQSGYVYSGPAASIFYQGGALGYVLIGLLAFALGILVTILCYLLRRKHQGEKEKRDD